MKLSVDQAITKAKSYKKRGEVVEAQRLLKAVLKSFPKNKKAQKELLILSKPKQQDIGDRDTQKEVDQLVVLYKNGRMPEVVKHAMALTEKYPDRFILWNLMGAAAAQIGQLDRAVFAFKKAINIKPGSAELYNNIGNVFFEQKKMDDALAAYFKSTSIKPNYADAYCNMANVLKHQGHLDEALTTYKKALSIKPDNAEVYNNIGTALRDQGKLEAAIEAFKKALSIKPKYLGAYFNMGLILQDQGKLAEAIEAYTKALSVNPNYAEAHNNMGITLQDQGKQEGAIEAYIKALSINPDYTDAHNNMGVTLQDQGKLEEAIEAYTKALSINPDYDEAYNNMGNALKGVTFTKPDRDLQSTIFSLLDRERYVRPNEIAKAAISLLKLEPTLGKHLQSIDTDIEESPLDVISYISELPLLLKLMSVCPLPDLELEKLLTNLRRYILLNISSVEEASVELLGLQSALALQCFTNEYIYSYSDEEEEILKLLEASVKKHLENNDQPSPHVVLTLASYKALNCYEWYQLLAVTDSIQEVFTRQVKEPQKENELKSHFSIVKEITNSISSEVRAQYEESPYPRWVNLAVDPMPISIVNMVNQIKLKFRSDKFTEVKRPDILIAGCGTGQHSIGTATRFKDAKVLAIDLSLSSLAYAKRKTEELGIENLEYLQTDILDLCQLNKQFDLIQSTGVLHHMDNPMVGWKVLTECLKPGGIMKIGLYSELARQDIVKVRQEISNAGIGSGDAEMRSFRDTIIKSYKNYYEQIKNSSDFYSLSTLRDLLFHVQEHRFTIPQIKACLAELGLEFCGFEEPSIVSHFRQTSKDKDDLYDLDKWQAYEEVNPRAFAGMYQFWCQKVD